MPRPAEKAVNEKALPMKKAKKYPPKARRKKRKAPKTKALRRPIVKQMEDKPDDVLVAEAQAGEKSKDDRLDFVIRLLVRRKKRGFIVKLVSRIYKVSVPTVDSDIAEAKKKFVDWYEDKKARELRAESEATMDEVMAQGFSKGDLQAVIQAQRHKDTVTRIVKDEETPAAKLGVVFLNSKAKDVKSWADKYSKSPKKSSK